MNVYEYSDRCITNRSSIALVVGNYVVNKANRNAERLRVRALDSNAYKPNFFFARQIYTIFRLVLFLSFWPLLYVCCMYAYGLVRVFLLIRLEDCAAVIDIYSPGPHNVSQYCKNDL